METCWHRREIPKLMYKGLEISRRLGIGKPYSKKSSSGLSVDQGVRYTFSDGDISIEAGEVGSYEKRRGEMLLVNDSSSEIVSFKNEVVLERVGSCALFFNPGDWQVTFENLYGEANGHQCLN